MPWKTDRPNGHTWIQFRLRDKQKTLRLGLIDDADAALVLVYVKRLHDAATTGKPTDSETRSWYRRQSDELKQKLFNVGLLDQLNVGTIKGLIDYFEHGKSRTNRHASTAVFHGQCARNLVDHFGEDCPLSHISSLEVEVFRAWLEKEGALRIDRKTGEIIERYPLAPVTVGRRWRHFISLFNKAEEKGWCRSNPFKTQKGFVTRNKSRKHYVDPVTTDQILKALPNTQMKLIFALMRWGGLRACEVGVLKWSDIGEQTMRIDSPKTGERHCPIFKQLQPYLLAAWNEREPDEELLAPYLAVRNRTSFYNYFLGVLKRAGIPRWERLLQNLRASRATEVYREYGGPLESEWIGHGVDVSEEDYQIQLQSDIDQAAGKGDWRQSWEENENRLSSKIVTLLPQR